MFRERVRGPLIVATPAQRAVEAAGSQRALALALDCSQQLISQCVKRGYFNMEHALKIERLYRISRDELVNKKKIQALNEFMRGGPLIAPTPTIVQNPTTGKIRPS